MYNIGYFLWVVCVRGRARALLLLLAFILKIQAEQLIVVLAYGTCIWSNIQTYSRINS